MKMPPATSRVLPLCLCLLFSYALMLSIIASFGPRTVHAGRAPGQADKSEISFPSSTKKQSREGEVLVRFRASASDQDKANVAAGISEQPALFLRTQPVIPVSSSVRAISIGVCRWWVLKDALV